MCICQGLASSRQSQQVFGGQSSYLECMAQVVPLTPLATPEGMRHD